jgi:hypothetical protein
MYSAAKPAFLELIEYGFSPAAPELRRTKFNYVLRLITSFIEFFTVLAAAGVAATGLTEERARDTWDSLLATPLGAREIIHAKMIGAAWKVRWVALLLVVLWVIGLLAGSIHPFGFGAALVLLVVSIWLMTALGTYASLFSCDSAQASNRALIPALLLSVSFLVCYVLPRNATVVLGAGSVPFVNWLSLVSHPDIREIVNSRGQSSFSPLGELGIHTSEGPARVFLALLLTTVGSILAAAWLSRAAVVGFDRAVGRPRRRQLEYEMQGEIAPAAQKTPLPA